MNCAHGSTPGSTAIAGAGTPHTINVNRIQPMPAKPQPLSFHPAPGYILGRPVTREELSKSTNKLLMPDSVGKLKDSVGIAEVLELGDKLKDDSTSIAVAVGDLIAYIPFTDAIIEEGSVKHNLVPYKNVMAIRPKQQA